MIVSKTYPLHHERELAWGPWKTVPASDRDRWP